MIVGIESTAHTFGVGVVNSGKILANVREMYTTESGGIIPIESAKHHREIAESVFERALKDANISEDKIEAISFSQAPGLAPCLVEGFKFAKKKATELNVSLIPVNHCVAHLEIGKITGAKDPVLLYTSGANTQIIAYSAGKYRVFGETLDIGVGNFIDNFARYLGLGFPVVRKSRNLLRRENLLSCLILLKEWMLLFQES
jgi:N6-L-threonylcarbamoyladenine synthase